jgi:type VI secretion system protein ImpE
MSAEDYLKEGKVEEALSDLKDQVRKDPANNNLRVFLFQILTVVGDWDRALTQLKVSSEMDPLAVPMLQTYQEAIRCEVLRTKVFQGETSPMVFGDPEQWIALLIESAKLCAQGSFEEAAGLRNEAFEAAPTTSGTINDQPFTWIADADPRMGPLLEAVVNGRYYWIPFHRIHAVNFEEPEDLRDMVWTPAQFTWANGGQAVGLIPTRYPGSETSEDNLIRLARKTEWEEKPGDTWLGRGQRLLATDAGDFSLLDIRSLKFDVEFEQPAESEGEPEQAESGASEPADG